MRFYRWKPDARRYGSVTQLKFDKAMSQLKSGRSQSLREICVKSTKYLVARYKTSSPNGTVKSIVRC